MKADRLCEETAKKYHQPIFRYCLHLLNGDIVAAEDCTQEVFMLLLEKKDKLDFDANIRGWLYASAQRIVKDYQKRERYRMSFISDVPLSDVELADDSVAVEADYVLDSLSAEERAILEAYYSAEYGTRTAVAKDFDMTPSQLYKRICSIRKNWQK